MENVYGSIGDMSPFINFDLVVQTEHKPGVVLFQNYEQLKQSSSKGVSYYSELL